MSRLLQPLARQFVRAMHPRQQRVSISALLEQGPCRLELDGQTG